MVTPLLHNFSYESLIGDLLSDSVNVYAQPFIPIDNNSSVIQISENDKLFCKY